MNPPSQPPGYPQQLPPKGGLSTGCIVAIVVVLVLIIIGFVALVLIAPIAGSVVIKKARMLEAKQAVASLVIAIKGYRVEYLHLPHVDPTPPTEDNEEYSSTDANGRALLEVLLAMGPPDRNPRLQQFWEPPPFKKNGAGWSPKAGLTDPWGSLGYRIILDYDGNGTIDDPEGVSGPITEPVLIYSAGPDGDFTTWLDNVCSWRM